MSASWRPWGLSRLGRHVFQAPGRDSEPEAWGDNAPSPRVAQSGARGHTQAQAALLPGFPKVENPVLGDPGLLSALKSHPILGEHLPPAPQGSRNCTQSPHSLSPEHGSGVRQDSGLLCPTGWGVRAGWEGSQETHAGPSAHGQEAARCPGPGAGLTVGSWVGQWQETGLTSGSVGPWPGLPGRQQLIPE